MGTAANALDPMRAGKDRSASGSLLTSTTRGRPARNSPSMRSRPARRVEMPPRSRGSSGGISCPRVPHVKRNRRRGDPSGSSRLSTTHARAASAARPRRASTASAWLGQGPGSSMRAAPKATASRMRSRRSLSASIRMRSVTSWSVIQYPCRRPPLAIPRALAVIQRVVPSARVWDRSQWARRNPEATKWPMASRRSASGITSATVRPVISGADRS